MLSPGAVRLVDTARLEQALQTARDPGTLLRLQHAAAAHEDVARRCDLVFAELVRLAEFRLRVERELGAMLAQFVRRGGYRPKSTRLTTPDPRNLPAGLSRQMAAKFRQLARVPEATFAAYLTACHGAARVPSANGARQFANRTAADLGPRVTTSRDPVRANALAGATLAATLRFFGDIEIYVGTGDVPCGRQLAPDAPTGRLQGGVCVAELADPTHWLPRLAAARVRHDLGEVLATLPRADRSPWLSVLAKEAWCCCLPTLAGAPPLLVYLGPRRRLFYLVFRELGPVWQTFPA